MRATPFTEDVEQFIRKHERTYVVELNRDGQIRQLLLLAMPAELATRLYQTAHTDGMPLSARWIKETILAQEEK